MANQITGKKLDDKVVITMLLVSILFLGITAFRYNARVKCNKEVGFVFRAPNDANFPFVNDIIYFTGEVGNGIESWTWDFGDKTPVDKKSGSNASHQYKAPGDYVVKLIINGECQGTKNIRINKRNEGGKTLPWRSNLGGFTTLYKGQEYIFMDSTAGAYAWSWGFGSEDPILQQTAKKIFNEVGNYRIHLVLNGDNEFNYFWKDVQVIERPGIPPPTQQPQVANVQPQKPIKDRVVPTAPNNPGGDEKPQPSSGGTIVLKPNQQRTPDVSDEELKGLLLTMNNVGFNMFDVDKYFYNQHLTNCTILFNDKGINSDQLKKNLEYYNQYGESFEVKIIKKNAEKNYIEQISIKAKLDPAKKRKFFGIFGGGAKYKFPYGG
jgi:hypothetical protein